MIPLQRSFLHVYLQQFSFLFLFWHHPKEKKNLPQISKRKFYFLGIKINFIINFPAFLVFMRTNKFPSFPWKKKKEGSYKTSKFTAWENNIYSHIHSYYNFIYDNILTVKIFMLNRKEKNIFFFPFFGGINFHMQS